MTLSPVERLALPLDVPDLDAARDWAQRLRGEVGVLKIGLELFTAVGPDAIRMTHDGGAACFLDLKLHDIPATMAKAVTSAARQRVRYLTIHAAAGPDALRACADAAAGTDTQLLAVTVLTSLDDAALKAVGFSGDAPETVAQLATVARDAGIDGFVCSALECAQVRTLVGPDATLVVPGIRPETADLGDQKRVATPAAALAAGADVLVVGRPIRDAADPVAAARAIVSDIATHARP